MQTQEASKMGKYQAVVKAKRNNFPTKAKQRQRPLSLQDRKRADQVWKKLVKMQPGNLETFTDGLAQFVGNKH